MHIGGSARAGTLLLPPAGRRQMTMRAGFPWRRAKGGRINDAEPRGQDARRNQLPTRCWPDAGPDQGMVEGRVGFEPTTSRLKVGGSTAELTALAADGATALECPHPGRR